MASFAEDLHAEITKVEADIEDFFKRFEGDAKVEEKAVLNDAKTDAAQLHQQVDAEKPEAEADASEALKNAVSDLSSTVSKVVSHPTSAVSDLESAGKEFVTQEEPAVAQVEGAVKTDAETDVKTVEGQISDLEHPAPAAATDAQPSAADSQEEGGEEPPHVDGEANGVDNPLNVSSANQASQAGPATVEPPLPAVEDNPKEGTLAHEIKTIVDNNAKIAEESKNVPDPAEGAETPDTFANRIPGGQRADVAGSVHPV